MRNWTSAVLLGLLLALVIATVVQLVRAGAM